MGSALMKQFIVSPRPTQRWVKSTESEFTSLSWPSVCSHSLARNKADVDATLLELENHG